MRWASAISEHLDLADAVAECVAAVRAELAEAPVDLAVVFVSNRHRERYEDLPRLLRGRLERGVLLGCSADGVIGAGHEVEGRAAVALTVGSLPDVRVVPFHVAAATLPDGDAPPAAWEALVGVAAAEEPQFILLADPFSAPAEELLAGLDFAFPGAVKVGGLASGARQAGGNALFLNDRVHRAGAVGVALAGNICIDAVVAQGCRPIGRPMRITRCQNHLLIELDGEPPLKVLRDLLDELPERDRALARHALHLGIVIDAFREEPRQGDFLIRNVLGIDPRRGALAVGERLREGQIVQFQLRDAETAEEDLQTMLTQYVWEEVGRRPSGAILFSCLGRGVHLFGRPDHDTGIFQAQLGRVPLGGFFCNGEIGPVGGTTFLHGYTSSFALFRPRVMEAART